MQAKQIIKKLYDNEALSGEEIIYLSKVLQNAGELKDEPIPYNHNSKQTSRAIGFESHTKYVLYSLEQNKKMQALVKEKGGINDLKKSELVELMEHQFLTDTLARRSFILGTFKEKNLE